MSKKEEFLNEVVQRMYEVVDAEKITITRTEKNNGVVKAGITIRTKGSNIAPVIYLEDMFLDYETHAKTMEEIIEIVNQVYQSAQTTISMGDEDGMFPYETSKNDLFIKVCNFKANEKRLQDLLYEQFLDLAIVPYIKIDMGNESLGGIAVTRDLAEKWDVSVDTIVQLAKENTMKLFKATNRPLFDVIKSLLGDVLGNEKIASFPPIYVLSNDQGVCGSMFLAMKNVLDDIRKEIGVEKYYILPSSIHELLLVTNENVNPNKLASMVRHVNTTQVQPEEILSYSVYEYSKDGLKIAATKEE